MIYESDNISFIGNGG